MTTPSIEGPTTFIGETVNYDVTNASGIISFVMVVQLVQSAPAPPGDYWSDMSLQMFGWESLRYVEWWGN